MFKCSECGEEWHVRGNLLIPNFYLEQDLPGGWRIGGKGCPACSYNEDLWDDEKQPVLDTEAMCSEISKQTGIDLNIVQKVIDAETGYLIKEGIAMEV